MTGFFGGNQSGNQGGGNSFNQGPFSFGPSPFDASMIQEALGSNLASVANRYAQLGMGGSTPAQEDAGFQHLAANALTGQEQTADVTNPAINTALQSPVGTGNPTTAQSLGQLATGVASLGSSNSFNSGVSSILGG